MANLGRVLPMLIKLGRTSAEVSQSSVAQKLERRMSATTSDRCINGDCMGLSTEWPKWRCNQRKTHDESTRDPHTKGNRDRRRRVGPQRPP